MQRVLALGDHEAGDPVVGIHGATSSSASASAGRRPDLRGPRGLEKAEELVTLSVCQGRGCRHGCSSEQAKSKGNLPDYSSTQLNKRLTQRPYPIMITQIHYRLTRFTQNHPSP
uniref:Uncharacterized protein n=1 Tax=Oryza punctata TaxID=4537 RepID=A0A0E0JYV7_ORYPU